MRSKPFLTLLLAVATLIFTFLLSYFNLLGKDSVAIINLSVGTYIFVYFFLLFVYYFSKKAHLNSAAILMFGNIFIKNTVVSLLLWYLLSNSLLNEPYRVLLFIAFYFMFTLALALDMSRYYNEY